MGRINSLRSIPILAFTAFLAITFITFFKNALELEDAEQAYYSQWLRLGYDDQPPLYTWLQYGFNKLLGVNKLSLSILRGLLFAGTLVALYKFAATRLRNYDRAKLAVLVLVLVPVFIDFTFRRLSHTSLLCFAIVGTYLAIENVLLKKELKGYLFLGVCLGIGLMSKYNYLFLAIPFFLVSFWDRDLRHAIWTPKLILSVFVMALLISPHLFWLLSVQEHQAFLAESVQVKTGNGMPGGLTSFLTLLTYIKGILALTFIIILAVVVGYYQKLLTFKKVNSSWFSRIFLLHFIILALFFILFKIQRVETRWLLPVLLPFTVLLVASIGLKNPKKWVRIGFFLFYGIIVIQTLRTPIEKMLGIASSVHYGFDPILEPLQINYPDYVWILPNVTYAGNLRLLAPERTIIAADDYSLPLKDIPTGKRVKVTIGRMDVESIVPTDSILGFGKEKENIYFYTDLRD